MTDSRPLSAGGDCCPPPDSARIAGQRWDIEYVRGETAGMRVVDNVGIMLSHLRLIKVDTDQASIAIRETVLHELLHACNAQSGFTEELDDEKLEERMVNHLAPLLLDLLRGNADLVAYLTA